MRQVLAMKRNTLNYCDEGGIACVQGIAYMPFVLF